MSTFTIYLNEPLLVRQVEVGEKLEETDLYASSTGRYLKCPCPGTLVEEGAPTMFLRPVKRDKDA